MEVGDRVVANPTLPEMPSFTGTLRYLGRVSFRDGLWAGIELDTYGADGRPQVGKNDGSVSGMRYFRCAEGRGIFVNAARVQAFVGPAPFAAAISSPPSNGGRLVTAGGFTFDSDIYKRELVGKTGLVTAQRTVVRSKPEENPFLSAIASKKKAGWSYIKDRLEDVRSALPASDDSKAFASKLLHLISCIHSDGVSLGDEPEKENASFKNIQRLQLLESQVASLVAERDGLLKELERRKLSIERKNTKEMATDDPEAGKSAISRYREQVDRLQALLEEKEQAVERASEENARLSAELALSRSKTAQGSGNLVTDLRDQIKQLGDQLADTKLALRKKEVDYDSLCEKIADLDNSKLKAELEKAHVEATDLRAELKSLRSRLELKNSELRAVQEGAAMHSGDPSDISRKCTELQKQLQQLKKDLVEVSLAKDNERQYFEQKVRNLEARLHEAERLQERLSSKERRLHEFEESLLEREAELLKLEEELRTMPAFNGEDNPQVANAVERLRKERDELSGKYEQAIVKAETTAARMKDGIEAEKAVFSAELAKQRAKNAEQHEQIVHLENVMLETGHQLQSQKDQIAALREQLEELRKRNASLETEKRKHVIRSLDRDASTSDLSPAAASPQASSTMPAKDALTSRLERQLVIVEQEKRLLEAEVQRLRRLTSDTKGAIETIRLSQSFAALPELPSAGKGSVVSQIAALEAEIREIDEQLGQAGLSKRVGEYIAMFRHNFDSIVGRLGAVFNAKPGTSYREKSPFLLADASEKLK